VPTFRSRPVEVDAIQWTGDNLAEVIAWAGRHAVPQPDGGLMVQTMHGSVWAQRNCWLVKGPDEVYPCDPAVFAAKYEAVDAPA
jgi:hypothetical protein